MTISCRRTYRTLLIWGLLVASNSHAETLRESLVSKGIDVTGLEHPNLGKLITGGNQLDEPDVFLTAYYLNDSSDLLHRPVQLELLNKKTGRWLHREVDRGSFEGGSMADIDHTKNGFYLYAHINPSAGTTIILSPSLEFRGAVYGSFLGDFADGSVVYANSMVHFAPTHPGRVSIFTPATKVDREIYPMKPYQAIRLEHIAKVKAAYDKLGQDWFREHNHHGDPELFTNSIGKAATDDATHSLVFTALFDNGEARADQLKKEGRCSDSFTEVVYVYRNVCTDKRLEYREILLEDLKKKFGDISPERLLEPETLQTIFEPQE